MARAIVLVSVITIIVALSWRAYSQDKQIELFKERFRGHVNRDQPVDCKFEVRFVDFFVDICSPWNPDALDIIYVYTIRMDILRGRRK